MSRTISLRQFSERNNKRILNKPNKLTLLSSASLLTLAACGGTATTPTPTPTINTRATSGDDWLVGGDGDDVLNGLAGDDVLEGLAGDDVLTGDEGTDVADYSDSNAGVTVVLDEGLTAGKGGHAEGDRLFSIENVIGSRYNDILIGDFNNNILDGGAGADELRGGGGADTADYSHSGDGVKVYLDGTAGTGGDAEGDILISIENVKGSKYNDILTGDANDNILDGGAGADELRGGDGTDTADYSHSGDGVEVYLDGTAGTGGDAEGDTLLTIENVIGSMHDDIITGDANRNYIQGLDGDDVLDGGLGADILDGGEGIDTVDYSHSGDGVEVYLDGTAGSGGDAEGDTLLTIENVIGSMHVDTIKGDANDNYIQGLDGDDTLYGGDGDDTLNGGDGNDELYGQAGNDTMDGGDGNDKFWGEADSNNIAGGDGFDTVTVRGNDLLFNVLAENMFSIQSFHDGGTSVNYVTSIEQIIWRSEDDSVIMETYDVKDLYREFIGTSFSSEDDFHNWLGSDSGYNYDGL
ncbi:MAG: calcium-binding protein [Alphaproteobacteria bacterium]|nr:calcium-binding protein [Alphaproteobacteria bacterium]